MPRIGIVLLPQHRWAEDAQRWWRAEEYGFDHAWTYDHLAWQDLADEPWFATVPTLTAAATVTSTIHLGTWVASPNFRHPVPFAKELMSLDDVSGGRFELGVGAGGTGWDATVLGADVLPPRERVDRLAEFVELLDLLLTRPVTTYRGTRYTAVDARMRPGCVQQPRLPFVVAANGPRAMRVAARHGQGWATTGATAPDDGPKAWWDGVARLAARFDRVCDEVAAATGDEVAAVTGPADKSAVRRYLSVDAGGYALDSPAYFADVVGRATELGFTDVVTHWPRPEGVYAGSEAVLEQVAADLPALRAG